MEFTQEQIKAIENLAGAAYTIKQVAMYLDIQADLLHEEYQDDDSAFRFHYDRGRLLKHAEVDIKLVGDAISGNLTATAIYKKTVKQNRLNNLKNELFGI